MKEFIIKRLLHFIPVFFGITLLSFTLTNIGNSDYIDIMESQQGISLTIEEKAQLRHELGLDESLPKQYINWLKNVMTGNMGTSYVSNKPVFETFCQKLPQTIILMISSLVVTLLISLPLGILCAIKQNTFVDYIIKLTSFLSQSFPQFFLSLLLIYIFCIKGQMLNVISSNSLEGLILPTMTLSIIMSAKYIRQIRTLMISKMKEDYVEAMKARGMKQSTIIKNVLKSSLLTLSTYIFLSIGSLLGGSAIVETIFMYDGIGKMAVDAIMTKDYPIIQAFVVYMAIIYIIINLISDIIYHHFDPRVNLYEK